MPQPKLARAEALARSLMKRWGLGPPGWGFRFNRRKRGMGRCVYPKTSPRRCGGWIELSAHYVLGDNPEESVRDTILHEIAHALAGPGTGHGPRWREMCLKVGAVPERCGEANMPLGPWRANCPSCGKLYAMHRRPKYVDTTGYYCTRAECGRERGTLSFRRVAAG